MSHRIVALPGDGIGPEIRDSAKQVLDALGGFETTDHLIGGASIDAHGTALTGIAAPDHGEASSTLGTSAERARPTREL